MLLARAVHEAMASNSSRASPMLAADTPNCARDEMTVRRLPNSCTTPEAIVPMALILDAWRSSFSISFCSVTSRTKSDVPVALPSSSHMEESVTSTSDLRPPLPTICVERPRTKPSPWQRSTAASSAAAPSPSTSLSIFCPPISSARYPNTSSAPRFQLMTVPVISKAMMASALDDATRARCSTSRRAVSRRLVSSTTSEPMTANRPTFSSAARAMP